MTALWQPFFFSPLSFVSKPVCSQFTRPIHAHTSLSQHLQMSSNTNENIGIANNNTNNNASNLSNNDGSQVVPTNDGNSLNSNQATSVPSTSPDQQTTQLPAGAQELSQPGSDSIPTPSPTPGTQPVASLASTSDLPIATPSAPPSSQDSTLPPSTSVPSAQRAPTETTPGAAQPTEHPNQRAYWCHQVCYHSIVENSGVRS